MDIEWLEMAEEREGVWGTERRGWASFVPGAGAEAGRVCELELRRGFGAGPDRIWEVDYHVWGNGRHPCI